MAVRAGVTLLFLSMIVQVRAGTVPDQRGAGFQLHMDMIQDSSNCDGAAMKGGEAAAPMDAAGTTTTPRPQPEGTLACGNKFYLYEGGQRNFTAARDFCISVSGRLPEPLNMDDERCIYLAIREYNAVREKWQSREVWSGFTDLDGDGIYHGQDGVTQLQALDHRWCCEPVGDGDEVCAGITVCNGQDHMEYDEDQCYTENSTLCEL